MAQGSRRATCAVGVRCLKKAGAGKMTTRRPLRHRCDLPGTLSTATAQEVSVQVLELSERGAFVEERPELLELQVGDRVRLSLSLQPGARWESDAVVSRLGSSRREVPHPSVQHVTVAANGFGLEFKHLDGQRQRALLQALDGLDEQ
jgi:hypothetical protein